MATTSGGNRLTTNAALALLASIAEHLEADLAPSDFFCRIAETIAGVVGARRVAFWRISPDFVLTVQPDPFGFDRTSKIHQARIALDTNRSEWLPELGPELRPAETTDSIAVPWSAGRNLVGVLAAYDSTGGFSKDDAWLLELAARATALVWPYNEAEQELRHTFARLAEADVARRQLLDNVASGGEEARRRFAASLHDDALQLLTAAELQLERIKPNADEAELAVQLDSLKQTMVEIESALRGLLERVSPVAMVMNLSLQKSLHDRLETLRRQTGIETNTRLTIPADLPPDLEQQVYRIVVEALTNVEKHASATRIRIVVEPREGGIGGEVVDDGAGFAVEERTHVPGHLGLVAMSERAQLAGGWCNVSSDPGTGTRVEFWLPA